MSSDLPSIIEDIEQGTITSVLADLIWPDLTKGGDIKPTLRNTKLAIEQLGLECSFNQFRHRKIVQGIPLQEYEGDLSDDCCAVIRDAILERFNFDPGADRTRDAVNALCLANPFHPFRDYLNGLDWDGVPRIDMLFPTYFGAADTILNRAIGRKMMVAAVRRVRQPGCKFDTVVVAEGKQGTGKSTAFKVLAGEENFSDAEILTLSPKEQMEMLEGVLIHELSELEGISRAETTKVKAFASRAEDAGRPAYGRFKETRKRQCILVGTTNEDKYLRDQTGNRRFWPVKTDIIDLVALERDRDQLWAEAAYWEVKEEALVLPEELWAVAAVEQEARLEDDPWMDSLENIWPTYIEKIDGFERIKSKELLGSVFNIPADRQASYHAKRLAKLMFKLGWNGPKTIRFKDCLAKGYERPLAAEH
jgi:predicted P-loop ATPase